MKRIVAVLMAVVLAGCATGGNGGAGQENTTRERAIAKIHTELAGAYYEREQYAISLQEIGVAMQADDKYAPAYTMRALVRMALREDEKADADFRRSIQLDGSSSETRNNYGWFMCQRGRAKESLKQFNEALKNPLYSTPEMAYVNLGICSKKLGMLKEAENNMQRALILQPNLASAMVALADLRYDVKDYAGAKSYWIKFLQTSPELNAEQLWLAIRIERKMRDRNAEASYTLQLRKRFPDSREALLLSQGE